MRTLKHAALALTLAAALPALAADPADPNAELQALKARVTELEKSKADLDRITVKAEALEDGRDAAGLKGFKISGYMDPTYVYNFNKERGTFQFVVPVAREGYGYDNSYFGSVALDIQKETDSGTKFRLTLIPMRSAGDVMGDASILHEASVWIPLGGLDTKLFAGQLPDWSGYEYMPPTQNKLITHNLLFDFTLPTTYTGVGVELLRGKWDVKLMLANLNASIRSIGEHIPMFVFRADYAGGEFWGFGLAGAEGYKTNFRAAPDGVDPILDGKDSRYDTVEVDGWYTRGDLTVNGQLSFGQQQKAAIARNAETGALQTAQWVGASVLVAYKFTPRFEGVFRADYLYNEKNGGGLLDYTDPNALNGIGPKNGGAYVLSDPADPASAVVPDYADPVWKKGANRYAITVGASYALNANVVLKGEYRFDGSNLTVFGNKDLLTGTGTDPRYKNANNLLSTSVVFSF